MSVVKGGIHPENFYGRSTARHDKIEAIIKQSDNRKRQKLPKFMGRLLGPTTTWEIFKKQQDALDFCLRRQNGLMPFAFEDINGRRMFMAAHPRVFWDRNYDRFFRDCSSYEIIREYSSCKLYLDIEFEYECNKNKNGNMMLNVILDIINFNLNNFFNITCTKNDILDLDSSSDCKFSHHVIYELNNVAFKDNYAVGNFVKKICNELRTALENSLSGDSTKLQEAADKYSLQTNDILDLFILDKKGQRKLMIDEGVYTKNRHFRLLGSSKKTKNIPLKISDSNKYKPNKCSPLDYFLDSLVTYFSWNVERVLEFGETSTYILCRSKKQHEPLGGSNCCVNLHVDLFIESLISPKGRIRKKVFFSDSSTIVYDIQGFRFCENIRREHKSNNIKYIVSLDTLTYYQKCYDPDCADFRSDIKRLPPEVGFLLEDDGSFMKDFDEFSEENSVETLGKMKSEDNFGGSISDEELDNIAKCAEAIIDVDW